MTLTALELATQIATRYSNLPQVEAVAVGGSQSTEKSDRFSDIDLYVYHNSLLSIDSRRAIATASASKVEVNNQFWEDGDEWIDAESGIHVDVMFRTTTWVEKELEGVLKHYNASIGYTTCIWFNVLNSQPLYDRNSWFKDLQATARQPYPSQLQQAIIAKNYPILRNNLSSYLYQISSAIERSDRISVNHRVSALLASYFDILFAVNQQPHPGEKRLVSLVEKQLLLIPDNLSQQIEQLLEAAGNGDRSVIKCANQLIDRLETLLVRQKLLP